MNIDRFSDKEENQSFILRALKQQRTTMVTIEPQGTDLLGIITLGLVCFSKFQWQEMLKYV